MNYSKSIEKIINLRKTRLLQADALLGELLSDTEFYNLEVASRAIQFDYASGKISQKTFDELAEQLNRKRQEYLSAHAITDEMLTPPLLCNICNDTGIIDGKPCKCALKFAISAAELESFGIAKHSFSEFDINLYAADIQPKMAKLCETLETFCKKFPHTNAKNIVLLGNTGVGKTFLASCIATNLASREENVLSLTAFAFVNRMLKYHTTFDSDKLSALSPVLDCQLLILDDLGTETILKNITIEYLYLVLNERLVSGKHTLITSNLSMSELSARYGERICSRIFDKRAAYVQVITSADLRKL